MWDLALVDADMRRELCQCNYVYIYDQLERNSNSKNEHCSFFILSLTQSLYDLNKCYLLDTSYPHLIKLILLASTI